MKNEQLSEHLEELSQSISHIVSHPLRPLSAFRSLKMKIGFLVFGAVATTVVLFWIGVQTGLIWPSAAGAIAAIVALVLTKFFAAGLTTPLKEIAQVSKRLSVGDYSQRVETLSRDEIGALAQTFNSMAEELSKTENLRKELIANASHELKTPVTALQAQLENLVDGIEQPTNEKLSSLLTQTEHLAALVKQLLDLSQLESGVAQLDFKPVKISSALNSARDVVSTNFPEITISIESREVYVQGDFHRLVQVFTNIMSNAARHCPENGMIRGSMHPKGNEIIVYIDDNGPGVDEAVVDHVFERFFRADTDRNTKDGGAGIGLAISKQIILLHNGSISVSSSDLGGARFAISFPVSKPNNETENVTGANASSNNKQSKETASWHSIQLAT
ncbi:MAG: ATP-binding protein [Acidimicrobiia bacterium]